MRFKTFLEATITGYEKEDHSIDSLIKLLKEHCKDSLHAGAESEQSQIWRGSKSVHKSGIFRPGSGERKSQNTANYYTVLLDTNPLNKGWPLRSKSFICSTLRRRAAAYGGERKSETSGTVLALFPFDDVDIGLANSSDIWNLKVKFKKYGLDETLVSLNNYWERFMATVGENNKVPTMPELLKLLRDNEDVIDDIFSDDTSSLPSYFIAEMEKAYSYKALGCELTNPGEVNHENSEVWFSGPCVGVTQHDWRAIAEEFKL